MMRKKHTRAVIQFVVFAAVAGGIVWYMLSRMSGEDRRLMMASIRQTSLLWLIPFFGAYLLSQWARARRWMLLLDPLGIHPTTTNTTFAVLIGYLVNLIPPRAGEVAKCTILAKYENVPADKMIGTIVAERVFDVLCLLIVIGAGIFWQGAALNDYLAGQLKGHAPSTGSLLTTGAIIGAIVTLLILIYKRNRDSRLGRFIGGLGSGAASIFHLRKRGMFSLYTVLIWGSYIVQIIVGFQAMPATAHLGAGEAMMVLIFGSAAIIASPGGVGLYPLLVGQLLRYGYGLNPADAAAFGWVSWLALTVATLLAGIASLLLLPFYNESPHDAQARVDTEPDI